MQEHRTIIKKKKGLRFLRKTKKGTLIPRTRDSSFIPSMGIQINTYLKISVSIR